LPLTGPRTWMLNRTTPENDVLAAGRNCGMDLERYAFSFGRLQLEAGATAADVRVIVEPLVRVVDSWRKAWQQAWSSLSANLPDVAGAPAAQAPKQSKKDAGRDTRTSLRRNPRRVEI